MLARQGVFLRDQDSAGFLSSIAAYLEFLASSPRIAPHLVALRDEAYTLGKEHTDRETKPAAYAFDIEESHIAQFDVREDDGATLGFTSLRRLASDFTFPTKVPLDPRTIDDQGRAGRIISSVAVHLDEVNWDSGKGAQEVSGVRRRFENLQWDQQQNHEKLVIASRSHPGVAFLRLERVARIVQGMRDDPSVVPAPLVVDASALEEELIRKCAFENLASADEARLKPLLRGLRDASERVELELMRRVDTLLSRLALVERFRARAEWHDRARLFKIATGATRSEEALRDEFARYLFDQGLDPLSEMHVGGGLRADIVDLAARPSFFVEAKRYSDSSDLTPTFIARAIAQGLDNAASLYAESQPSEAFIVIFRLGGSRAVLPDEPIVIEGISFYLRLVDIAPAETSGSRNRDNPRTFDIDQVIALAFAERNVSNI
jgi:hypothetical protein